MATATTKTKPKRQRDPDRTVGNLSTPAKEISPTTAADLRSSGYNPRTISPAKLSMLKAAMKEFGDLGGVVFNRTTGRLISGHQRGKNLDPTWPITKEACTDNTGTVAHGYIETPDGRFAYREVEWDEQKEQAGNLAANQHGGEFDDDLLSQMLKELNDSGYDMDLTGFDDSELKALLLEFKEDGLGEEDPEVIPVEDPFVKLGDLWTWGEQRVLCGDSTSTIDMDKLLMGEKAVLCVTDPPYGISYETKAGKIENDDLKPDALEEFLSSAFSVMNHALKNGGSWYVYYADGAGTGLAFYRAVAAHKKRLMLKQNLIWVKSSPTLNRFNYNGQHEPCLYGHVAGAPMFYDGDFTRTTVIDDDIDLSKLSKPELIKYAREVKAKYEPVSTIIRIDKPTKSPLHPTQKPVKLFERNIYASSRPGEVVIDLFSGSGTLCIACRKTGRRGRAIELSPHYLQASLTRMREYDGTEPMLMEDGGKMVPFSEVEKKRNKSK